MSPAASRMGSATGAAVVVVVVVGGVGGVVGGVVTGNVVNTVGPIPITEVVGATGVGGMDVSSPANRAPRTARSKMIVITMTTAAVTTSGLVDLGLKPASRRCGCRRFYWGGRVLNPTNHSGSDSPSIVKRHW